MIYLTVPARIGSTRFHAKVLKSLGDKLVIQHVVERALRVKKRIGSNCQVVVAVDSEEILNALSEYKEIEVILTDPNCPSGSDRIYEALSSLGDLKPKKDDLVINIQGDEPFIDSALVEGLINRLLEDQSSDWVSGYTDLDPSKLQDVNLVKCIVNKQRSAIYFSRFPIPYSRTKYSTGEPVCFQHIGVYGYRYHALEGFCLADKAEIETFEGLEQLRALYLGYKISMVLSKKPSIGIDTEEDLKRAESMLSSFNASKS